MRDRGLATLAQQLDAARQARRWTIVTLAEYSGYHPNTLLRVLHGENVTLTTFRDVASALGLDVSLTPPAGEPAGQAPARDAIAERLDP